MASLSFNDNEVFCPLKKLSPEVDIQLKIKKALPFME